MSEQTIDPQMKVVITHDHKCEKIAFAPAMAQGREWFIGKLTEPIAEFPHETHCMHLKTNFKEVVYLCNEADFRNMMIMCEAAIGRPNESWMKAMVESARIKTELSEENPPDNETDVRSMIYHFIPDASTVEITPIDIYVDFPYESLDDEDNDDQCARIASEMAERLINKLPAYELIDYGCARHKYSWFTLKRK